MGLITSASTLSYDAIGEYAELLAERHGVVAPNGRVDLDKLIRKLGGRVSVRDGRESIHIAGPKDFDIHLPPVTSARRDRFTIAHELGHYFVHYRHPGFEGPASFNRGGRSLLETQANVFASALLMPAKHFIQANTRYDGDSRRLAQHFDVSPAAAEVRQQVLNLPRP